MRFTHKPAQCSACRNVPNKDRRGFKLKAALGDTSAYQYATIYARWGHQAMALEWLETASRLRDPGPVYLKTDPLMDPIRDEPRFQNVEGIEVSELKWLAMR